MGIEQELDAVEAWLGVRLPGAYRTFLQSHAEKIIGEKILLYGPESIIERNETFEVKAYAPGYLAIGDDSGGRSFLIFLAADNGPVYSSDQGDMDPAGFEVVASCLETWLGDSSSDRAPFPSS